MTTTPLAPRDVDPVRRSLLSHRDEILDVARAYHAARGRGGLVAVHAGGQPQFVLYRVPKDLDAPTAPGGTGAIREAVRSYDPDREAVVLVVDSARELYSCWRVGGPDASPEAALVWCA